MLFCAAIRDRDQAVERHIHDSLALLPVLDQLASSQDGQSVRVIDVGTGGGFPGVVLAIARPEWQVLTLSGFYLTIPVQMDCHHCAPSTKMLQRQPDAAAGAGQHAL